MNTSFVRMFALIPALAAVAAFVPCRTSAERSLISLQQPSASAAPTVSEPAEKRVTAYTLPPDLYRKAHNLGTIAFWGQLVTAFYSLIALVLLLNWRTAPKIRDIAEKASSVRFLQAAIFATLFFLAFDVLCLPTGMFRQWILRKCGLSNQGWGS